MPVSALRAFKGRVDAAMHGLEDLLGVGGTKKDIWLLVISGVFLLVSLVIPAEVRASLPFDPAWVAIVLCGVPIVCEALIGLITEFDITADVLVAIALVASVAIGETFAAGEVAFIMQLGGLLEELTVARARAGIEKLVHLTPRTARRISRPGEPLADALAAAFEADDEARATGRASNLRGTLADALAGLSGAGVSREEVVAAEEVRVGDVLRVNPGETVPVDGVIVAGETSIDQAVMTGESMPVDKGPGDEVSSGTLNRFGSFDMRAVKVGEDSSIQRMIRLVQSADAGKAKIVNLADRWAVWIVVIAISAALITWAVTGEILRAVTILVVFCPCALVLATRTAIMAAIGNATKHGFLVREGDALERLAAVRRVAFDKTGTLTCGTPRVVAVEAVGPADMGGSDAAAELYALVASAELRSEHPLGKAIVAGWRESVGGDAADARAGRVVEPEGFSMLPGRGVEAVCALPVLGDPSGDVAVATGLAGGDTLACGVAQTGVVLADGPARRDSAETRTPSVASAVAGVASRHTDGVTRVRVIAGNCELVAERGLELPAELLRAAQRHLDEGCTVTYVACLPADGGAGAHAGAPAPRYGLIALADAPRTDAQATIAAIQATGVEPVLLTGDNESAAASVARRLGIHEHRASCRPEDKLAWIDSEQRAGHAVCMVGDGVNDAPALKRAQVGIAMGGVGSDIAVDAADIALVNDDVRELPHLLALSRRMMTTIKLNLTFSMTLNFIAIALAITGVLNPVVGALVHNAGSVLVIINSALLLRWRLRRARANG